MALQTIISEWTGIRPLIMHNGYMADRTNPYTIQIKAITKKKASTLTDEENAARDRLEWEAGLYYDKKLGPFIPADNIERCVQLGAMKSRKGKDVQAAVLCSESQFAIEYTGPRDLDKMYADPRFTLRKGVVVSKARVIRVRPMIPTGWKLVVGLEFDASVINRADIQAAIINAGTLIGLGDWRPKFGRFSATFSE